MTAVRSIFVVDDHPLVREWLSMLLNQQEDLAVCGDADSATVALGLIEQLKPDVVIVDITLRSGSGLELVKDIRLVSPDSVCLVLSMHDETVYAERALRAGARGYVTKRDSTKKIVGAIRQMLEGKLYLSDAMKAHLAEKLVGGGAMLTDVGHLSDRELEVFGMLGQGRETKEIAESLNISIKTVQVYYARIREKFRLGNHTDLLREAMRWWDAQSGRQDGLPL